MAKIDEMSWRELLAELERVKAERDAAIADMEDLAMGNTCDHCAHDPRNCGNGLCYGCGVFKWRGIQAATEAEDNANKYGPSDPNWDTGRGGADE